MLHCAKLNIEKILTENEAFGGLYLGSHSNSKHYYVKVASQIFLEQYRNRNGTDSNGVLYNKYLTLLHRELKAYGKDIKLPHCWYRWGDIVVSHCIPFIQWNHSAQNHTSVTWYGDCVKYDNKDEVVVLIKKNASLFISNHSGSEAHEIAKDEVYDGAPFRFQNEYRKLRESLDPTNRTAQIDNYLEYIANLFESSMSTFPSEFKKINSQKEEFISVFNVMLREKASSKDIFDLTEYFWFFFCYHLRLNKKCHENVSKDVLSHWEESLPWETMKFDHILQNFTDKFYNGSYRDECLESILTRRAERMEILDRLDSDL